MLPAVVGLAFDPSVTVLGRAVRLDTIAIAVSILAALLAAALLAGAAGPDARGRALRRGDLLSIALGIVPGGVVGGRLGYVLLHLDYYRDHAPAIADPGQGGLELTLGVLGGLATGAYVCRLLDAPLGRWAHVAAVPVLVAIAGGKLGQALGGGGQGAPAELAWATAYLGPGPWGSLAPAVPSQPAQLYEAAVAAAALVLAVGLLAAGAFARRDGRLLVAALGAWMAGRFAIVFAWRDDAVLGPLRAEQLLLAAGLAALGLTWLVVARRSSRDERLAGPSWPDPTVSHRWRDPGTTVQG